MKPVRIIFAAFLLFMSAVSVASAQGGEVADFIGNFYQLAIAIAGILAVGMIVAGAIYISVSGAVDKQAEGKDMITSALIGLLLVFGSYLILRTVQPGLVELELGRLATTAPAGGATAGGTSFADCGDRAETQVADKDAHKEWGGWGAVTREDAVPGEAAFWNCTPPKVEIVLGKTSSVKKFEVWQHLYYRGVAEDEEGNIDLTNASFRCGIWAMKEIAEFKIVDWRGGSPLMYIDRGEWEYQTRSTEVFKESPRIYEYSQYLEGEKFGAYHVFNYGSSISFKVRLRLREGEQLRSDEWLPCP